MTDQNRLYHNYGSHLWVGDDVHTGDKNGTSGEQFSISLSTLSFFALFPIDVVSCGVPLRYFSILWRQVGLSLVTKLLVWNLGISEPIEAFEYVLYIYIIYVHTHT